MSKLYLSLCLLFLASCSVELPDAKLCSTAGLFSAGADCVTTLTGKHTELNFDEWLGFLEPQPEKINPDGSKTPERGSAVCMSSDDWTAIKTALQKLCEKAGTWCTKEAKKELEKVSANIGGLQARVMKKRKGKT